MKDDIGNGGNLPTRAYVESHCYRLRHDALHIVAKIMAGNPNPNVQQINALLIGVQERLLEGMFFDPNLQREIKTMLFKFQTTTLMQRMQDRRGERQRRNSFFEQLSSEL